MTVLEQNTCEAIIKIANELEEIKNILKVISEKSCEDPISKVLRGQNVKV